MKQTGLAMSGGGHRAALFSLGVALAICKVKKNTQVTCISSVSGGSITNGYLARHCEYSRVEYSEFLGIANRFTKLIGGGTIWASRRTWLYLFGSLILAVICAFFIMLLSINCGFKILLFIFLLLVVESIYFSFRGIICAWAFHERLYYQTNGRRTKLSQIARRNLNHIFCATDLHAGEHVYFSGDFVFSYRFGFGKPAEVSLDRVVQASACFPGGFPPSVMPTQQFGFSGGNSTSNKLILTDGGVYDNLAEQWASGLTARRKRIPEHQNLWQSIDEVIVINACRDTPFSKLQWLQIPLIGEVLSLLRIVSVMNDNTTVTRRQVMPKSFDDAFRTHQGMTGCYLRIDSAPYTNAMRIAARFQEVQDNPEIDPLLKERGPRAQRVLLGLSELATLACSSHTSNETTPAHVNPATIEEYWSEIVKESSEAATTLKGFGYEKSVRLVYHAMILAVCNLHIFLDYDFPSQLPTLDEFRFQLSQAEKYSEFQGNPNTANS